MLQLIFYIILLNLSYQLLGLLGSIGFFVVIIFPIIVLGVSRIYLEKNPTWIGFFCSLLIPISWVVISYSQIFTGNNAHSADGGDALFFLQYWFVITGSILLNLLGMFLPKIKKYFYREKVI